MALVFSMSCFAPRYRPAPSDALIEMLPHVPGFGDGKFAEKESTGGMVYVIESVAASLTIAYEHSTE